MLLRILLETLRRRKSRVGLAVLAVLIGSALVATLFAVSSEINERLTRELRSYGANILVVPEAAGLQVEVGGVSYSPLGDQALIDERLLPKIKTIFWRHNIVGFAPYLTVPVVVDTSTEPIALTGTWFEHEVRLPRGTSVVTGTGLQGKADDEILFKTGVKAIAPWWKLRGEWPAESDARGSVVGSALAEQLKLNPGDRFTTRYRDRSIDLEVTGVVTTGGYEENQVFVNLAAAQGLAGIESGVSRVLVSALTMPKEKLAPEIRNKRPEEMTPKEYDQWYCSPIVESVVKQIEEVIPGSEGKAVRQFSEQEGSFSMKVQLLLVLITAIALLASAFAVMATMTTLVLERRPEIGLMKAIGAQRSQVAGIFLTEAAVLGLIGGVFGYLAGSQLARFVGEQVFGIPLAMNAIALPVTLLLATGIAVLGSAWPVYRAVQVDPVGLLRGG